MVNENTRNKLIFHDDYELIIEWIKLLIKNEVFTPDPSITYSTSTILKHFPDVQGKEVLDIGCGTWILGIHCFKKWAKNVIFSDVNPKALENTEENIQKNGIKWNYKIVDSDLFKNIPESFDCIFANLPISNDAFKLKERTESIALRFLQECKDHIKQDWKIFFVWGSFEDISPLIEAIEELWYLYKIIEENKLGFTWSLIEINP